MSYRIEYQGIKKVRGVEKRKVSATALVGTVLLAGLLLICVLRPQGAQALRAALIPGDPAVTVGALEMLAGELGAGESLKEALLCFCRTVLDAAA